MRNFLSKIKFFFKKEYQYAYFFQLETVLIDKEYIAQENLRVEIINYIRTELNKLKKDIEYVDICPDLKEYITSCVVMSEKPIKDPGLMPILFEIFAYKKLKETKNFTYPWEIKIFKNKGKEIQILKFKVKSYT